MGSASTSAAQTTLPISQLEIGPTNPRKVKATDRGTIHELAASIERVGVLQPVIVRKSKSGKYEVLAGRRRLEAAKKAGLVEMPVRVVEADDEQARNIGLIENGQREPLDPLDEAAAIASCLAGGHSIKDVAIALSKSPAYIARRSNLRNLHPDLIEQLRRADGFLRSWTAGAVEMLALLAPEQQKELVERRGWDNHPPSEDEVQQHIGYEIRILSSAPWSLEDEDLVPAAGPCTRCPWNSSTCPDLFGGILEGANSKEQPVCRSGDCWAKKLETWRDRQLAAAQEKYGPSLVLISGPVVYGGSNTEEHTAGALSELPVPQGKKALSEHEYEKIKKDAEGAVPAFIVKGTGAGKVFWVKTKKTGTAKTKQAQAQEVKEGTPEHLDHLEERMHRRRKMLVVDWAKELIGKAKCPTLDTLIGLIFSYGAPLNQTLAEPLKDRQAAFKKKDVDELWEVVRGEIHRFLTRSEAVEVEQQYAESGWLCEVLGLNDKYEQLIEKAEEEVPESRQMKKLREEFAGVAK